MNPATLWRTACMPVNNQWSRKEQRQAEILSLFTFIAFFVGLYSLIKWNKNGHDALIITSIALIVLEVLSAATLRWLKNPFIALNIGFIGMALHALNIIYQSGGVVDSTQAFWIPLLIVAFFLSGTRIMALAWSIAIIGVASVMTYQHLLGVNFPSLELSDSAQRVEVWSGTVLPLIVICIAQAFTAKQRDNAIEKAELATQESDKVAVDAQAGSHRLADVLQRATTNSMELKNVSAQLESQSKQLDGQVNDLNLNCESQASAAE